MHKVYVHQYFTVTYANSVLHVSTRKREVGLTSHEGDEVLTAVVNILTLEEGMDEFIQAVDTDLWLRMDDMLRVIRFDDSIWKDSQNYLGGNSFVIIPPRLSFTNLVLAHTYFNSQLIGLIKPDSLDVINLCLRSAMWQRIKGVSFSKAWKIKGLLKNEQFMGLNPLNLKADYNRLPHLKGILMKSQGIGFNA